MTVISKGEIREEGGVYQLQPRGGVGGADYVNVPPQWVHFY